MRITFYDSTEKMLDDLDRAMQEADRNVQTWQKTIKRGDYFWHDTEYGFTILGQVLQNGYQVKRLQNYRFCKCYSVACPEGELLDVHISVIKGRLTKEGFEDRLKEINGA